LGISYLYCSVEMEWNLSRTTCHYFEEAGVGFTGYFTNGGWLWHYHAAYSIGLSPKSRVQQEFPT
jgi:hypothetical protein